MNEATLRQAVINYLDRYDEWFITVDARPFDAEASAQAATARDEALERLREEA